MIIKIKIYIKIKINKYKKNHIIAKKKIYFNTIVAVKKILKLFYLLLPILKKIIIWNKCKKA
jgi:hypothetical protein